MHLRVQKKGYYRHSASSVNIKQKRKKSVLCLNDVLIVVTVSQKKGSSCFVSEETGSNSEMKNMTEEQTVKWNQLTRTRTPV